MAVVCGKPRHLRRGRRRTHHDIVWTVMNCISVIIIIIIIIIMRLRRYVPSTVSGVARAAVLMQGFEGSSYH